MLEFVVTVTCGEDEIAAYRKYVDKYGQKGRYNIGWIRHNKEFIGYGEEVYSATELKEIYEKIA